MSILLQDKFIEIVSELLALNDGNDVYDVEEQLSTLGSLHQDDECIDDGADGEDEYVIKRVMTLSSESKSCVIRMYFGNNTKTMGYYSVSKA